jgi:hypothetical protein
MGSRIISRTSEAEIVAAASKNTTARQNDKYQGTV